jgi:rubrerythrin
VHYAAIEADCIREFNRRAVMKKPTCLFTAIVVLLTVVPEVRGMQNPDAGSVLHNLQIAFNAENNAKARYLAYAITADQEGYGQIASLFRAAAKAEEFHARNFAQEIDRLGGTRQVKTETPNVKSTSENLEAAIQAETYERDTMYPEFRRVAQDFYQMDAVRTINFAYNGEVTHAALLSEAYRNLETMRGASRTYYVCTECGYTTKDVPNRACHSCYISAEEFAQVS